MSGASDASEIDASDASEIDDSVRLQFFDVFIHNFVKNHMFFSGCR